MRRLWAPTGRGPGLRESSSRTLGRGILIRGRSGPLMDATSLIAGVVTGAIGMGYLVYGRRQQQLVPFIAGVALCAYPYFVDGLVLTILVGVVLMALPFLLRF